MQDIQIAVADLPAAIQFGVLWPPNWTQRSYFDMPHVYIHFRYLINGHSIGLVFRGRMPASLRRVRHCVTTRSYHTLI
jgi:hypothetical protein